MRREMARANAAYLGDYALGLKPADFHVEWQDLCTQHDRLIIFAPIEHGKSQQLSVLRPIWELGHNPNLRIALISETAPMAYKWLDKIKLNIESNPRVHEIFPDLRPARRRNRPEHWLTKAILVQRDEAFSFREKDYSIEALGVDGSIMGSRFDIAVLDDTITRRNGLTRGGRDGHFDWLHDTLLGRITKQGKVWIPNNAWHTEDTLHRLERERGDVWKVVRYAAGDTNCHWPEQWDAARIQAKADELREIEAARQLFNVALSDQTGLLPVEAARDCQELCDDPPEWWGGGHSDQDFRFIVAGLDLGGTDKSTGAESVCTVAGVGKRDNHKHVIHMRAGRWLGIELLKQMVTIQREHRPREWVVETNAIQLHIATMLRDQDLMRAAGATLEEARAIRVFGKYTDAEAKREEKWGIRSMGADFDARRWRLPKRQREISELLREIGSYTLIEHTGDRLMSLWLADLRLRGYAGIFALKATSR